MNVRAIEHRTTLSTPTEGTAGLRPLHYGVSRSTAVRTLAVVGIALATTVACSSSGTKAASSSSATSTVASSVASAYDPGPVVSISIATAGASASFMGGYVAIDSGIMTKHQLTIKAITAVTPQACNAAVVAGSVDFCADGGGNFAAQLNAPGRIKVVAAYSTSAQELFAASGVTSVSQLKGKTVAATTAGGPYDVGARGFLQKNGLTPDKDVSITYLQTPDAIFSALKTGKIAAGVLSPPTDAAARTAGLTDLGDVSPYIQPNSIAVNSSFASSHPQAVTNFIAALIEGTATAETNESVSEASIGKYTNTTDATVLQQSYTAYKTGLKVQAYPIDQVQASLAVLAASVPAAKTADPATLTDSTYYTQAAAIK